MRKTQQHLYTKHAQITLNRCKMKKRLSWSLGSGSEWAHDLCLDEAWHLEVEIFTKSTLLHISCLKSAAERTSDISCFAGLSAVCGGGP
jgi:hypothetical protein